MIPLPSSTGSLFKKLGQEFNKILKVTSIKNVILATIWGDNLLMIMRNLLKTLERESGDDNGDANKAAEKLIEKIPKYDIEGKEIDGELKE
jgi:hypothetical protein